MLVTLVYLLISGFVGIELYLNLKFKRLGRLTEAHPSTGLGLSLGLSWLLIVIFPAAGLVVLIASVVSTAIIQPFYILRHKIKTSGSKTQAQYAELVAAWRPIFKLMMIPFKITWFLINVPVKVQRYWNTAFHSDTIEMAEEAA